MPRRFRQLDQDAPLESFASELRHLRDMAPAKRERPEGTRQRARSRPLSVDDVAAKYEVGRASIYAALSGTRLPSRATLTAMVESWALHGSDDLGYWMRRRAEIDAALAPVSKDAETSEKVSDDLRFSERDAMEAQRRLAELLTELVDLSQQPRKVISYETRYSPSTLSSALSGRSLPSREFLRALLPALHVPPDQARELLSLRQKAAVGRRRKTALS